MHVGKKYSTQGEHWRQAPRIMPRATSRAPSIPKDRWHDPKDLEAKLQKNKVNVLYCYSHVCHLAASVAVEMSGKGYPVMELEGGWRWWKNDGFDIEK